MRPEQEIGVFRKKDGVFVIAQQRDVKNDADDQKAFAFRRVSDAVDLRREGVVDQKGTKHDPDAVNVAQSVKNKRRDDQGDVRKNRQMAFVQQEIDDRRQRHENKDKRKRIEKHRPVPFFVIPTNCFFYTGKRRTGQ